MWRESLVRFSVEQHPQKASPDDSLSDLLIWLVRQ
jgi:hypothetical protein